VSDNPQDDSEAVDDPLGDVIDHLEEDVELHQGKLTTFALLYCV
jgi:hypothetical protein